MPRSKKKQGGETPRTPGSATPKDSSAKREFNPSTPKTSTPKPGGVTTLFSTPKSRTPSKTANDDSIAGHERARGTLTGIAYKIKTGCVNWHNYIQLWNDKVKEGVSYIEDIIRVKTEFMSDPDYGSSRFEFPSEFIEIVEKLQAFFTTMQPILNKMKDQNSVFKACQDLHKLNTSADGLSVSMGRLSLNSSQDKRDCDELPVFDSLFIEDYVCYSENLLHMYTKEFECKECAVGLLIQEETLNSSFYQISWVYQPYIDDQKAKLMLELMLQDAGLKDV